MTPFYLLAAATKTAVLNINASIWKPNLLALAQAAGWGPGMLLNVNVAVGVNVCNLVITGFPHDSVTLTNRGVIGGEAGGGVGMKTDARCRVDNQGGRIFGGGGNGGDGGGSSCFYNSTYLSGWGGAGGGGAGFIGSGNSVVMIAASAGSPGTYQIYTGALLGGHSAPWVQGGQGGDGGATGFSGGEGDVGKYGGTASGAVNEVGYRGGRAGNAVEGNALITWIAEGTITGPRV